MKLKTRIDHINRNNSVVKIRHVHIWRRITG